ncbi:lysophospholipid acyltransferase family protein [Tahibacter caeni]|uniref:lysophospholipid acyltransferase family protein n=1 Tax=Tahibacter caeni TaxID=1453545 RepID=UPI0021481785
MISVERSLYEKFPRLAEGVAKSLSKPVVSLLRRIVCEDEINASIARYGRYSGFEFIEQVLEGFDVSYSVANTDRENIPVDGPVVIVANHPLGALDALSLLQLVGSVRRDVRILANDVLMHLEPLHSLLLPINVFGGDTSKPSGMRGAYRALEDGQALIVFPSGEVSRMRPNGVRDGRWSSGFLRMARKTGAPILPVHVDARNSPLFYGVSLLAKPLSALLLAREMFGAKHMRIGFTIGQAVPTQALERENATPEQLAKAMRRHVYQLAKRRPNRFTTSTAIAHPEPPAVVRKALKERAEVLGATTDGKRILLLDAQPDCPVMREIGRLRELAFRRVGEGTGNRRDLDRFDAHYRHIVLWDEEALAVVGAYRLGEGRAILRDHGMAGLYSASLFDYAPEADVFLQDAVELGRSFIQPAYWGSRSLDYLWQGIGAFLRKRPEVRYLFGPVSLSASLPQPVRELIVHTHGRFFADPEHLATAKNPFRISPEVAREADAALEGKDAKAALSLLKQQLAVSDQAIPTLYRQYVDLCEPDGVRFLAFGVDPQFGGCVDGLIRLDLTRLKPAKRSRYLSDPGPSSE